VIFAGTPDFSVPCLEALLEQKLDLIAVYTQPDRAAGRGKKLRQSPVKQAALKAGLEVIQPPSFKQADALDTLAALHTDLMVVVAYGLILPPAVLSTPALGCVNVHASLLPRWRGAAPIQRAIEAGDEKTGVCLMQMDKGLDTGPVLACRQHPVAPDETGGQLHDTLSVMGADLLRDNLGDILTGSLKPVTQDTQGVKYAHKLSKQDSRIDWHMSAASIANKVRAFNPWPVTSSSVNGQIVRIHSALPVDGRESSAATPGEIIGASAEGIHIATGEGSLNITRIQKPGGRVLKVRDFLNGFALKPGQIFE